MPVKRWLHRCLFYLITLEVKCGLQKLISMEKYCIIYYIKLFQIFCTWHFWGLGPYMNIKYLCQICVCHMLFIYVFITRRFHKYTFHSVYITVYINLTHRLHVHFRKFACMFPPFTCTLFTFMFYTISMYAFTCSFHTVYMYMYV